jgi:hypothetical protein
VGDDAIVSAEGVLDPHENTPETLL